MCRTTGRRIAPWRFRLHPGGSDCSLKGRIVTWARKLQRGGSVCQLGSTDCSLEAQIAAAQIATWRLRLQPWGSDCSHGVQIAACGPRLQPGGSGGSHCSLEAQPSLETRIGAWRLRGVSGLCPLVPACAGMWRLTARPLNILKHLDWQPVASKALSD